MIYLITLWVIPFILTIFLIWWDLPKPCYLNSWEFKNRQPFILTALIPIVNILLLIGLFVIIIEEKIDTLNFKIK